MTRSTSASSTARCNGGGAAMASLALCLVLAVPSTGLAGSLTVNSLDDFDDYLPGDGACTKDAQTATCSLRAAVEEANFDASPDTITFAPGLAGTIALSLGHISVSESVHIQGPGRDVVTVDAGGASRHFFFTGTSLELSGLTLTGGAQTSAGSLYIFPDADSVQLSDLLFEGNHATTGAGGAISTLGTTPLTELILEGVDFVANTALQSGGALYLNVPDSYVVISDSTFVDNQAGEIGGAIAFRVDGPAQLALQRSVFVGNQATGEASWGGALYLADTGSGNLVATIERCSFVDGSAAFGGALFLDVALGSLTNTTVGANQAGTGSALYAIGNSEATLASCTVAGNSGGVALHSAASTVSLGHTVIANALAACSGTVTSLGYNLVTDASCGLGEASDLQSTDPLLGAPTLSATASPAYVPYTVSPAVDSGNPAGCPALPSGTLGTDQWGEPRPWDGDGDAEARCDRGAIETQRLLYDGFEDGGTLGWTDAVP